MLLLGSDRYITLEYNDNNKAEAYAGEHLSLVKIYGKVKVIKVINKYKVYEDTINYNDFINNQNEWINNTYYDCISITGKKVSYHQSELRGNQVELETYDNNTKIIIKLYHLGDVYVNVGDIIDNDTIIGKQGNTGLVLSNKDKTDISYGSHVYIEVIDEYNNYLNPREYASYNKMVNYKEQTNIIDYNKKQIKVLIDKIDIRAKPSISSKIIGVIYKDEIYNVLNEVINDNYIWYNINTSLGLKGFVGHEKNKNYLFVSNEDNKIIPTVKVFDKIKKIKLIYTCDKDGMYAVKLKVGDNLYLE